MHIVAVTGITGKSGQHLLKRMMRERDAVRDYRFILICREQTAHSANPAGHALVEEALSCPGLNLCAARADLNDSSALRTIFRQYHADFLLHLAGVDFSPSVVRAALDSGIRNLILVHTTGIYSKYKAAGELYRQIEAEIGRMTDACRAEGRPASVTILRPTMIYGDLHDRNISVFIRMVDHLRLFPTVSGGAYDLQPVWCKDLGNAYFDVLMNWEKTQGREYILSGGKPIQLIELFRVIERQLGVRNHYFSCPFPLAYAGAWVIYLLTFTKIDLREKVQRLVKPRAFDHEAAAADFGYAPADFETGVREEIELYRRAKGKKNG